MLVVSDAQVAPALAPWFRRALGVDAVAARDWGLQQAEDEAIFLAAREHGPGAVVITKDSDFLDLLLRYGPPPQIVWLRCGNTTNACLRQLFTARWPDVRRLLEAGEALIEIR